MSSYVTNPLVVSVVTYPWRYDMATSLIRAVVVAACAGMTLVLIGCGGGDSSSSAMNLATSVTPAIEPDLQSVEVLPEPALFDCESVLPLPTLDVNDSLEGVWEGALVDCTSETDEAVIAYFTKEGRMHLQWADPAINAGMMKGVMQADGDTFGGGGRYFDAGSWSTELRVEGLIREGTPTWNVEGWFIERNRMEGLWAADSGIYGYFSLDYAAGQNHPPVALDKWPADWQLWAARSDISEGSSELIGSWSIDPAGAVKGEDIQGCQYTGQFESAEPQFFYGLALTITGCALEGDYSGIGRPTSGPFNDRLYVAVDDGDQRALVMLFLSK